MFSFFKKIFPGNPEEKFWHWFSENHNLLFNFEENEKKAFSSLGTEMKKIHENLTFEFGPVLKNGKREFVISANGIKEAFPAVEMLYKKAPNLDKWIITKFRPRRNPTHQELNFAGRNFKASDIFFKLHRDKDKTGIQLFINNFDPEKYQLFAQVGFLYLDTTLGEYDVETKVGFVEFLGTNHKDFPGAKPVTKLAKNFDSFNS